MSMFRSAAEISSSESSSDESDRTDARPISSSDCHPANHKANPAANLDGGAAPTTVQSERPMNTVPTNTTLPDHSAVLDREADSHANMMTAALLEFYCLSRAADILNAQDGSQEKYTRDSPEVQYLGKKMYAYESQFLSSRGILSDGIEKEEWSKTRQYYRDNLDLLGVTALEDLNLSAPKTRPSLISGTTDLELVRKSANERKFEPSAQYGQFSKPAGLRNGPWNPSKRLPSSENVRALQNIQLDMANLLPPVLPFFSSSSASFPFIQPQSSHHPVHHMSRYAVEFCEIKILGRGSFGEVYHVRNHIDGQNYAVKKIPLSQRRLEQLQSGGQNQLEIIMKEIRTLASLEHTNIVRYYGAWVEQAQFSGYHPPIELPRHEQDADLPQPTTSKTSSSDNDALGEETFGIVFENSEGSLQEAHSSTASTETNIPSLNRQRRRQSYSTMASYRSRKSLSRSVEDDDEVESIPRPFSLPSPGPLSTIGASDDIFSDGMSQGPLKMQIGQRHGVRSQAPAVVLHIQMSLHPISLNSYLNADSIASADGISSSGRRHCFHLVPSLRLMLAIISGVEYLHAKGIVHRDLKPANIFLSPSETCRCRPCTACNLKTLAETHFCHPRIGDFGLVADISHLNDTLNDGTRPSFSKCPQMNRIVGTEFYRPPVWEERQDMAHQNGGPLGQDFHPVDEKLDVYALGVILFELLYRFRTRMERQLALSQLTRGDKSVKCAERATLPVDFADKLHLSKLQLSDGVSVAEALSMCLKGMVQPKPSLRLTCSEVRETLERILAASEAIHAGSYSSSPIA